MCCGWALALAITNLISYGLGNLTREMMTLNEEKYNYSEYG